VPSSASEEEGDWLDRRRISFSLYIGSYIVGLGLLAVLLRWPPVLLLLWSGVGWSGCGGSSGGAGESAAISFGEALWRIKEGLVGFASRRAFLLSLPRLRWWQFWCLRQAWEVCLPTCAAGLVLDPTSFGGLLPLLAFSGVRYADVFDILLLLAMENYDVPSVRGSASSCGRTLRSPATSMTGQFLQGSGCNFHFFQGFLCKIWDVNYQKLISNATRFSPKKGVWVCISQNFLYLFCFDFRKINVRTKNFEKYTSCAKTHGGKLLPPCPTTLSPCRHGARRQDSTSGGRAARHDARTLLPSATVAGPYRRATWN
jgi:hypothetical protein